jgi:ABC-type multidrug transport system ATPase subunit
VLELKDISFLANPQDEGSKLLNQVGLKIPRGSLVAIVGPSGCGKSTLLKVIAGILEPQNGSVHWEDRDLAEEDLSPSEIGYVPQFSIAHEHLTVRESISFAAQLRVTGLDKEASEKRTGDVLHAVGLEAIQNRMIRVLSGGQKRRVALAMEMVSHPSLLLCDEVTSGLDPQSEDSMVRLMHQLAQEEGRIVLSVTHSLHHLDLYDSVIVMYQGSIAYHGPGRFLLHHFDVKHPEDIFSQLSHRTAQEWHQSWQKRRQAYDEFYDSKISSAKLKESEAHEKKRTSSDDSESSTPSFGSQSFILLQRRWRIFFRDRSQIWLQAALLLGFPCLVVIFALQGLPQLQNLSMDADGNIIRQLRESNSFIIQSTKVGSLVSGLVMFQVILLALMGSNNSAREVASERLIYEKERLSGLRAGSYLTSKVIFVFSLCFVQSIWMALFVNQVCRFPGNIFTQIALLTLLNASMSSICLGVSCLTRTPEQASLISIYLVGFQLPLSGAVLALPDMVSTFTRPFIASYWSWSGVLQTMRDTRFYDAVQMVTQTSLSSVELCFWTLGCHIIFGLFLAFIGCRKGQWNSF